MGRKKYISLKEQKALDAALHADSSDSGSSDSDSKEDTAKPTSSSDRLEALGPGGRIRSKAGRGTGTLAAGTRGPLKQLSAALPRMPSGNDVPRLRSSSESTDNDSESNNSEEEKAEQDMLRVRAVQVAKARHSSLKQNKKPCTKNLPATMSPEKQKELEDAQV